MKLQPYYISLSLLVCLSCAKSDRRPVSASTDAGIKNAARLHVRMGAVGLRQAVARNAAGITVIVPEGYNYEGDSQSLHILFVAQKTQGMFTANISIEPLPNIDIESVLESLPPLALPGAHIRCYEFAAAFGKGAATPGVTTGRMIDTRWGRTCQVEIDRPSIGAVALTTVLQGRTNKHYVAIGHFAKNDVDARAAYEQVIHSWQL